MLYVRWRSTQLLRHAQLITRVKNRVSPESYNYKLEEAALARTTAMTREPAAVVPHSTSYNTSLGHSFRAWRGTNQQRPDALPQRRF